MTATPWLLQPATLRGLTARRLRRGALARFGELAGHPEFTPAGLAATHPALDSANRPAWTAAVAEEALLLAQTDRARATALVTATAGDLPEARPFPRGPTLRDLLGRRAAAVAVPVNTGTFDRPGDLLHVWLVADPENALNGPDDSSRLADPAEVTQAAGAAAGLAWKIFLADEAGGSASYLGRSWQLGGALAARALADGRGAMIQRLAAGWVVTGRVDASNRGQAVRVNLGNKPDLALRDQDGRRHWLLPATNAEDLTEGFLRRTLGRLGRAHDVDGAWGHVSGEHTRDEAPAGDESWPGQGGVMHCLVSNALGPMLASFLHTRPERIVLWYSEEMRRERGGVLKGALEQLHGAGVLKVMPALEAPGIDSENIAQAERQLLAHPTLHPARSGTASGPVLFNVTGGNFLMRFAVANLARLNPDLRLVYRDVNSTGSLHFTELRYRSAVASTRHVVGDMKPAGLHWGDLITGFLPKLPRENLASYLADLALHGKKSEKPAPAPEIPVVSRF